MRFLHQSRARLGLGEPRRLGLVSPRPGCPNHVPFVAATFARCWKVFVFGAVAAMPFSHVRAQISEEEVAEKFAKFMLYTACQPIYLFVEPLTDDAEDIGLSRQAIVNAAESRLRAARLYEPRPREPRLLSVNIRVSVSTFTVILAFRKTLFDRLTQSYGLATTWETGTYGIHGRDATYILGVLSRHMDEFIVEFLRVNEPACSDPQ